MSGGQQADNTLHENAIGWAILLAVLGILAYIFWYFKAEEVRNIIRWIRYGEAWVLQWFIILGEMMGISDGTFQYRGQKISFWDVFNGNQNIINREIRRGADPNTSLYFGMANYGKNSLTFQHLSLFSAMTMGVMKYVFISVTGMAALWTMFKGPRSHYRQRMALDGLIHRQAKNFPIIAPFVKFNPSLQPPRPPGSPVPAELPLFAEALGPEEWLAYTGNTAPDGKVDETIAKKHFEKQLIGRWKGPKALKPYQQILLAAFCLKAARKRDAADSLLGRLALCWSAEKGINFSKDRKLLPEARKVLNNKQLSGKTLAVCNRHAFVTTALLRALSFAREEGGVLAPAQFVWLRAHDRTLWYPLNNLGRDSYHTEALGAMAHYKVEKLTDRPVPVPKVEHAIETITDYMKSNIARPIPQLDYSQSKKRGIKKAV